MYRTNLSRSLAAFLLAVCLGAHAAEPAPAQIGYTRVEIDDYVAKHQPLRPNTRTLLPPSYVEFDARVEQSPRPAKAEYLKMAQSMMGLADPPAVGHQMLLLTPRGARLPVYVEDALVARLARDGGAMTGARFYGYHIYTYAKGPAIVVSGFGKK